MNYSFILPSGPKGYQPPNLHCRISHGISLQVPKRIRSHRDRSQLHIECRYGTRGGKVENPLDYTHKIDAVLQPADLLTYIWMLCAEELTELPNVVFENCKAFEFCGNTIKRPTLRPCKYCRLQVSLHSINRDQTVSDSAPVLANVHDVTVDCDKSPTNRHEVTNHAENGAVQPANIRTIQN